MPGPIESRPQVPASERVPMPEASPDASFEQPAPAPEQAPAEERPAPAPAPAPVTPHLPTSPTPQLEKDPEQMRIERRLEEDLWDVYRTLEPGVRDKFKEAGERTAITLREALGTSKMKPRFALHHILGWLRIIPRVNKYFLEQEAKIKTDQVMEIDREYRETHVL